MSVQVIHGSFAAAPGVANESIHQWTGSDGKTYIKRCDAIGQCTLSQIVSSKNCKWNWRRAHRECKTSSREVPMGEEAVKMGMKEDAKKIAYEQQIMSGVFGQEAVKSGVKIADSITFQEGLKTVEKRAEGFCPEGAMCSAPVYGRPVWVWILMLVVLVLAMYGLQDA